MPSTSSTISNGGNWFTERTWGPFTGVAENPPRLTSREAAYPGHFRMSPNHGHRRSFSARQRSSYYAASEVASRASVSP
jgi:hypothetical protein